MIEIRSARGEVRLSGSTSSRRRHIDSAHSPLVAAPAVRRAALRSSTSAERSHQSDDPEDGNREQRTDQALDQRIAHDQEADGSRRRPVPIWMAAITRAP